MCGSQIIQQQSAVHKDLTQRPTRKASNFNGWVLFILIGMDRENLYNMKRLLGADPEGKLHYLMAFSGRPGEAVEDPWYTRKFDSCAAQITEGCRGVLEYVLAEYKGRCE